MKIKNAYDEKKNVYDDETFMMIKKFMMIKRL